MPNDVVDNGGSITTNNIDDINIDLSDYADWKDMGFESFQQLESAIDKELNSGFNISFNNGSIDSDADEVMSNQMAGIFGIPYQFSPTVDPLIYDKNAGTGKNVAIGRKYMERIMSVIPILFLTPGEPLFMSGVGSKARLSAAREIVDFEAKFDKDTDPNDLNLQETDGKYYSFGSNYIEYQKYANIALRALAQFMGLQDVWIPGADEGKMIHLKSIRVEDLLNKRFKKWFGTNSVIPFFVDAENSISENFSNDTSESMLSQKANSFSDTAKELQFIMGSHDLGGIAGNIKKAVSDLGTNIGDSVVDVMQNVLGPVAGKSLISRVTNELTTVISGGKIVFPEIWSGSSYSRSYNISLKLRSPDPDPLSIYLNIYVPIILLLSMAAPRQIDNSSNSYQSPFLVRATYKSIFNCDLGIISSLDITKGGEDKWNAMGMPTSADVTVTIKDLYSTFFISKNQGLVNNTAQMDYLSLMAGIDMNELDVLRVIKLAKMIYGDKPRDFALDTWGGIKQKLNRIANDIVGNFADTRFNG